MSTIYAKALCPRRSKRRAPSSKDSLFSRAALHRNIYPDTRSTNRSLRLYNLFRSSHPLPLFLSRSSSQFLFARMRVRKRRYSFFLYVEMRSFCSSLAFYRSDREPPSLSRIIHLDSRRRATSRSPLYGSRERTRARLFDFNLCADEWDRWHGFACRIDENKKV